MMISLLFTGPIGGIYTTVIGCSIIFLRGNVAGGMFKLVAELATILAFAAIRRGVVTKSIAATASRVLVMTIVNYFALPFFYPKFYPSEAAVVGLLLPLAVFNLTQALVNIIPAEIIYNRLDGWWRLRSPETNSVEPERRWWTGRELNPRSPPFSAQDLRRRHSARLNYQPLLPFESRIIFNVMESATYRKKQFYSMHA